MWCDCIACNIISYFQLVAVTSSVQCSNMKLLTTTILLLFLATTLESRMRRRRVRGEDHGGGGGVKRQGGRGQCGNQRQCW